MKGMKFCESGKKGEDLVHGTGTQFPKYIINLQRPSIYVQCHVGADTSKNQSLNQSIKLSFYQSINSDQMIYLLVI